MDHTTSGVMFLDVLQGYLKAFLTFGEDYPVSGQNSRPFLNLCVLVFRRAKSETISLVIDLLVWVQKWLLASHLALE